MQNINNGSVVNLGSSSFGEAKQEEAERNAGLGRYMVRGVWV